MFKLRLVIGLPDEGNKKLNKKEPKNIKTLGGVIAVFQILSSDVSEVVHPDEISSIFKTDEVSEVEIPSLRINFRDIPLSQVFSLLRERFKSSHVNTNADINICIGNMYHDFIDDHIPREKYRTIHDTALVSHYSDKIQELNYKFFSRK